MGRREIFYAQHVYTSLTEDFSTLRFPRNDSVESAVSDYMAEIAQFNNRYFAIAQHDSPFAVARVPRVSITTLSFRMSQDSGYVVVRRENFHAPVIHPKKITKEIIINALKTALLVSQ
ncbi:hypothetical protein ABIB62_001540 [Mucilaginibacter sp. UYP25]|uniref:hypothetical protein n=1 Tax=unclassified Mucilaginibacter TaxID=2617802 RepID=UPI003395B9A3